MSDKPNPTDPRGKPRERHQPSSDFRGAQPEQPEQPERTEQEARDRGVSDPETAERLGADRLAQEQPPPGQRAVEEQAANRQAAQGVPPEEHAEVHQSQHDVDAVRDDPYAQAIAHGAPSGTTEAQHETSDVGLNILVVAGAVVGGLIIVALVVVRLLTNVFYSSPDTQPQGGSPIEAAAPPAAVEMRVNPVSALDRYQAAAQETLDSYGWVDEATGVARIPITRAMTLIIEGLSPAIGQD